MKYIKAFEQYIVPARTPEPILKWDILKFLSSRNVMCSLPEILSNFPNEEKTKEALQALSDKFYVDAETGGYKVTRDGEEHIKTISELW